MARPAPVAAPAAEPGPDVVRLLSDLSRVVDSLSQRLAVLERSQAATPGERPILDRLADLESRLSNAESDLNRTVSRSADAAALVQSAAAAGELPAMLPIGFIRLRLPSGVFGFQHVASGLHNRSFISLQKKVREWEAKRAKVQGATASLREAAAAGFFDQSADQAKAAKADQAKAPAGFQVIGSRVFRRSASGALSLLGPVADFPSEAAAAAGKAGA